MGCSSKHTKYQPNSEEFICPICGKNGLVVDVLYIDDEEEGNNECDKLHVDDHVKCFSCEYEVRGEKFSSLLSKKANLVVCPCCKGKGMVPKGQGK